MSNKSSKFPGGIPLTLSVPFGLCMGRSENVHFRTNPIPALTIFNFQVGLTLPTLYSRGKVSLLLIGISVELFIHQIRIPSLSRSNKLLSIPSLVFKTNTLFASLRNEKKFFFVYMNNNRYYSSQYLQF